MPMQGQFNDCRGKPAISRTLDEPIQCRSRSITLDWDRFRIIRVPPLKFSWGTSRPMRSQHFELSTNQKPRFQPDPRYWPNLESTNPMPMYQLTDNRVALDYEWNAYCLPTKCPLTINGISIDSNWMPIDYEWNVNGLPIECKWNVNWFPMECQLNTSGMPLDNKWSVTHLPMECQLTTN